MTATDIANDILAKLAVLDKECEEGIYDPVRTYEDTAALVKRACAELVRFDRATTRIVELTPENCRHNEAIDPNTGECLDCGEFLR